MESRHISNETSNDSNTNVLETQNELNNEQNKEDIMPGELPPSPQGPAWNTRSKSAQANTPSVNYTDSALSVDIGNIPIPKSYHEAMCSPERNEWKEACQNEMESHTENNTWEVIQEPPFGRDIIGSRWVFTRKIDADGNIIQHKARLVAQGYTQRPGFDYDIMYSPVFSITTVRLLIANSY